MEPVEITAGRLHLRPWQAGDADALARAVDDPEVVRWTTLSPGAAARFVHEEVPQQWADGTAAEMAVLDATTGELLAGSGVHAIADGQAEVGWWVAAPARGRGIAVEATQVVARWAFGSLGLERLTAYVEVGNWASRATAEKAGFRVEGVLRGWPAPSERRADTWVCGVLASDELVDQRRLPPLGRPTDGVVALRRVEERDLPDVARACDDPDSARWLPMPTPYGLEDARTWALGIVPAEWAEGTIASAAVVDARTDALLGAVSTKVSRPTGVGEIGYWTAPWARGRGVASRAAALMAEWTVGPLGLGRVELLADVENLASQRAAERAGFVREGVLLGARPAPRRPDVRRDMVVFSWPRGTAAAAGSS